MMSMLSTGMLISNKIHNACVMYFLMLPFDHSPIYVIYVIAVHTNMHI